jgi:hypothetical protein
MLLYVGINASPERAMERQVLGKCLCAMGIILKFCAKKERIGHGIVLEDA